MATSLITGFVDALNNVCTERSATTNNVAEQGNNFNMSVNYMLPYHSTKNYIEIKLDEKQEETWKTFQLLLSTTSEVLTGKISSQDHAVLIE